MVDFKSFGQEDIEARVRENGVGFSIYFEPKEAKTLGLQMVRNISESQLKGKINFLSDQGVDV